MQQSEGRQLACAFGWSVDTGVFERVVVTVSTVLLAYIPSGDDDVVVCMNHLPLERDTAVTYGGIARSLSKAFGTHRGLDYLIDFCPCLRASPFLVLHPARSSFFILAPAFS